jgi:hypothetical protein
VFLFSAAGLDASETKSFMYCEGKLLLILTKPKLPEVNIARNSKNHPTVKYGQVITTFPTEPHKSIQFHRNNNKADMNSSYV